MPRETMAPGVWVTDKAQVMAQAGDGGRVGGRGRA